jgi:hypothetical protein
MAQSCAPAPRVFEPEDRGDRRPDWTDPPPGPDPLDLGSAAGVAYLLRGPLYGEVDVSEAHAHFIGHGLAATTGSSRSPPAGRASTTPYQLNSVQKHSSV